MSAGFAAIGAIAGWTGSNIQFALQSPAVILSVAGLFCLLALAALGVIPLRMPAALESRLSVRQGGSIGTSALCGLGSVLILGPCVTAPLAGALLYIAQTGDWLLGAAALAMLGFGQGLPLMVLAVFGRGVLPKSGAWLEHSRLILAALMAGMAIFLAGRVLPAPTELVLRALLAFAVAAMIPWTAAFGRFAAAMLIGAGTVQLAGAFCGGSDPLRPFASFGPVSAATPTTTVTSTSEFENALAASAGEVRLVYVTADWCIICRSLEARVFSRPEVQEALSQHPFIKVDVTDFNGKGGDRRADSAGAG